MFAIAFDLDIALLKEYYGTPSYNNAYGEIRKLLGDLGFKNVQGSVYISDSSNGLTHVYRAIRALSEIEWFRASVTDIRAFKVEDWSDFTAIVKG